MMESCRNDSAETCFRLTVLRSGAKPPCLEAGRVLCRGCPGWTVMIEAAREPGSLWGVLPLHCSATNLTIRREGPDDAAG